MRTFDRTLMLAIGLAFGATQAFGFDGTTRPSADVGAPVQAAPAQGMMPASANSRAIDVPRPPGSIPRSGVGSAMGLPSGTLPRPRAPIPVLSTTPGAPALDHSLSPPAFAAPAAPITPIEAFRSGARAMRDGQKDKAIKQLEYAAEQGVPGAIWKLGRMYADGDGVELNKARAYDYFRRLTNMHGDDSAGTPNTRYLANAFVTLGLYHLEGIPGTLKANPNVAREMFRYAAAYFADPEAQYQLGRMYLLGAGTSKDAIQAARWLRLSANKGDHRAQALLGSMLFKGEEVSRQAALGLFWLIVAKDGAKPDETWITDMYASALAQANETERAMARKYLEDWLKSRRE
jgi:TPR repeat protein